METTTNQNQDTIPRSSVEQLLGYNSSFNGPSPVVAGADPAEVDKFWKGEKALLVNKITSDLRQCHYDMARFGPTYGHDYCVKVWEIVNPQLRTVNFLAKCGPMAIWKAIYRKASLKAQQDLPKPVAMAAEKSFEELAKERSRQAARRMAL